jgi:hypothetical protein
MSDISDVKSPCASNEDLRFVLDALLKAYKPLLEDELKLAESAEALVEARENNPPSCEDEIKLARNLFEPFFTREVATRLLPAEGREVFGDAEEWAWCYRHILCCLIFGWLVCRGPRTYKGFAYYLNRYWRCVREALGQPVSNPPTVAEQRDFSTLNRILVQAYKPFLQGQVKDLNYPVGIPQQIQSGQIDCHTDDDAASTVFERLLTPEATAALFGESAFANYGKNPIFRACRCYCICALEFGCCLAQARTLREGTRCVEDFFCCLKRCFEPLIAVLDTPPACSSLTMTPLCAGLAIEITGTAAGAAFTSYTLTYSLGGPILNGAVVYPDCTTPPLNPASTTPVTAGVLGYLDTYLLPLGTTEATVYLDVYGSGGLHLTVDVVFQFDIVYSEITAVAEVPTFTQQDPFNPLPSNIKMVQNLLPGLSGFERSVGGSISVTGSAYADGCGNIIAQYQLAQFAAPGAVPLPMITPSPTTLGGTSLLPAPVVYDGTLAHPFLSCTSNVVLGGNLVAEWSVCPSPPFPAGLGSLYQYPWGSLPSAPNGGRCVLFLEVDQYSIATPHTAMTVAGQDQVAVWIDNYPVVGFLTQIGNVIGCGDLNLSAFVGTTAPVLGVAWDYPIDFSAQQLTPNDNFGSYSLSYQKNGGGPVGFLPSDYTPNSTPAGTAPTVRVPNLWQAAAPTAVQAAVLASWDIVGALDGGPPVPPPSANCTLNAAASPWQLPRGCHCAYVIDLIVGDTTWVGDGGDNHSNVGAPGWQYALTIINDITAATYTGTVDTTGTTITWASGMHFQLWWAAGTTITVNGVVYTILSVTSVTSITLTTSAGTQTGVLYSFSS